MEDEMVGWHHRLNGHECEQTLGDTEGPGRLACCSPRGCKESEMSEQVNNHHHQIQFVYTLLPMVQCHKMCGREGLGLLFLSPLQPPPPTGFGRTWQQAFGLLLMDHFLDLSSRITLPTPLCLSGSNIWG